MAPDWAEWSSEAIDRLWTGEGLAMKNSEEEEVVVVEGSGGQRCNPRTSWLRGPGDELLAVPVGRPPKHRGRA